MVFSSVTLVLAQNFIALNSQASSNWQTTIASEYLFDNNYYKINTNKQSEHTAKVSPSSKISIKQHRSVLNLGYSGNYGKNANHPDDDQFNHNIHTDFQLKIGDLSAFDFSAAYLTSRDERGVTASPVVSTAALAKWSGKKTSASFTVPLISKSFIRIGGKFEERNYETSYAFSSRNVSELNLTSILPITVKTAFLVKYLLQTTNYHSNSSNSTQLNRLSAGARWRTTGKTTSFANVGYEVNSPNNANPSYSGLFTDIRFLWQRKSYSAVNFTLSRKTTDNANTAEGYLVSSIAGFVWNHRYTDKWRSNIGSSLSFDEYGSGRKDVYVNPSLGINLKKSRHFLYHLNFQLMKRKSSQSALNYDNLIIQTGLKMQLESL